MFKQNVIQIKFYLSLRDNFVSILFLFQINKCNCFLRQNVELPNIVSRLLLNKAGRMCDKLNKCKVVCAGVDAMTPRTVNAIRDTVSVKTQCGDSMTVNPEDILVMRKTFSPESNAVTIMDIEGVLVEDEIDKVNKQFYKHVV